MTLGSVLTLTKVCNFRGLFNDAVSIVKWWEENEENHEKHVSITSVLAHNWAPSLCRQNFNKP
jgi:hypothetical protein